MFPFHNIKPYPSSFFTSRLFRSPSSSIFLVLLLFYFLEDIYSRFFFELCSQENENTHRPATPVFCHLFVISPPLAPSRTNRNPSNTPSSCNNILRQPSQLASSNPSHFFPAFVCPPNDATTRDKASETAPFCVPIYPPVLAEQNEQASTNHSKDGPL